MAGPAPVFVREAVVVGCEQVGEGAEVAGDGVLRGGDVGGVGGTDLDSINRSVNLSSCKYPDIGGTLPGE